MIISHCLGALLWLFLDLQFSEEMSWRQAIYERRDSWDKERTWEREQRARRGALGGRILTLHLSSLVAVPLQCVPSWDTRWHTHKHEHMQVQAIKKFSKMHLSSLVALLQAIIRKPSKLYICHHYFHSPIILLLHPLYLPIWTFCDRHTWMLAPNIFLVTCSLCLHEVIIVYSWS